MGDHEFDPELDPELDIGQEAIDRRLTEHAARWRSALPPGPEPSLDRATGRDRSWGVRAPALTAAATLVVLAGVWAVGHHGTGGPAPATPGNDLVVPWAPLPATDPQFPEPSNDVRLVAKEAPPCTIGDLRILGRTVEAAAGTAYLTVQLGLDASTPCHLLGYPEVVPLDTAGNPLDVPVAHDTTGSPDAVLVTASSPAAVVVSWSVTHYCGSIDNARLRVTLPDGGGDFSVEGFGATSCNPDEGQPAMQVLPIQAAYDQTPQSPYEKVTATGDLDVTVPVGAGIDFQVTLTSPADLPLDPCPDYQILVGSRMDTHGLNCAAVPYVDAAGRPYLPAGVGVAFAMHADGLDAPLYSPKFLWVLSAPGHAIAHGILRVGDAAPPDGRLTELVTMDGGPAPGVSQKVTDGEVHVVGGDVDLLAAVEGGQFEVAVPPGTYQVWATTPQYDGGSAACWPLDTNGDSTRDDVTVTGGSAVTLRISCQMK
jgi:hypothetical protein